MPRQNLKRNKAITLRMTLEEFADFKTKLDRAKQKNQTDFILALLSKKPIVVIEDLHPMLKELKRHSNNLNQVSRRLNETSHFGENATKVMNECWKAYRTITALPAELDKVVINALIKRKGEQDQTAEGYGLHNQPAESGAGDEPISGQ
jgi:spore cortex formation protein SpoVR/YcgB (stage V sporulation)